MFATEILDFTLLTLSGTPVTVGTVITAVVILIVSWWVSRGLQRAIGRALQRRTVAEGSITVITRLVHYAVIFVGIGIALDTLSRMPVIPSSLASILSTKLKSRKGAVTEPMYVIPEGSCGTFTIWRTSRHP